MYVPAHYTQSQVFILEKKQVIPKYDMSEIYPQTCQILSIIHEELVYIKSLLTISIRFSL